MPFSEKGEKAIADLFNLLDTNKNGTLEKTEQKKAMKNIHSMLLPETRWAWEGMDTNRDNQVDADEFVAFFAHLGAAAGVDAVQNEADADADRLAAALELGRRCLGVQAGLFAALLIALH